MKKYITPDVKERALYDEPILDEGSYPANEDEDDEGDDLSNKYFFDEENSYKGKTVWE